MCLVTYSKLSEYSSLKKLQKFKEIDYSKPQWGYIEITSQCAHKCPWCYGQFPMKSHHMSLDEYKTVLSKMYQMNILQLSLTGGEPTEHHQFREMITLADDYGFLTHLLTNGDNIDDEMLEFLKEKNVKQIQFNFQGKKWHNKLHKIRTSADITDLIKKCKNLGFETVATTVVGEYNIHDLSDIFEEADNAGVDRLRIWDVLKSPKYRGDIPIEDIFETSQSAAKELGFNHVISYDPKATGDIKINCIAMSGLIIYSTADCTLNWCPGLYDPPELGNWITDSVEELLDGARIYNDRMKRLHTDKICVCRIPRQDLDKERFIESS